MNTRKKRNSPRETACLNLLTLAANHMIEEGILTTKLDQVIDPVSRQFEVDGIGKIRAFIRTTSFGEVMFDVILNPLDDEDSHKRFSRYHLRGEAQASELLEREEGFYWQDWGKRSFRTSRSALERLNASSIPLKEYFNPKNKR